MTTTVTTTLRTYADRTGHTLPCVSRTAAVLAASGDFDGLALTDSQREAAAVDALTDEDVECTCGATDIVLTATTA